VDTTCGVGRFGFFRMVEPDTFVSVKVGEVTIVVVFERPSWDNSEQAGGGADALNRTAGEELLLEVWLGVGAEPVVGESVAVAAKANFEAFMARRCDRLGRF